MQYPPGQRPCKEALDALTAVTLTQLQAGSGPTDPDGNVRAALRNAKTVLSYRAGESPYYSAASYNTTADRVAATIDPLIASYDREDPNTPYEEATDYGSTEGAFGDAQITMSRECY